MTPAFGFSVGDFVSAIGLVHKIGKSLKAIGGASSQYQLVQVELHSLDNVLRILQQIEPTEENATHLSAIRGMALACQFPLQEFITKIETYEALLNPQTKKFVRAAPRKAQWALFMDEEIEKLRAGVAAKVVSINLLLQLHVFQTSHLREVRRREAHNHLLEKIQDQRQKMEDTHLMLERDRLQTQQHFHEQRQRLANTHAMLEREHIQTRQHFETLIDDTKSVKSAIQTSVSTMVSLRGFGEQLVSFIAAFPAEIRGLLGKMLRSNFEIYNLVLAVQNSIAASPTSLISSNIKFTDALGRQSELTYQHFQHWSIFEAFLKHEFKNVPGGHQVATGQYHIIDHQRNGALVIKPRWNQLIFPGANLSMSIVLSKLGLQSRKCPRPSCGRLNTLTDDCTQLSCASCGLTYHQIGPDFKRSAEEIEVIDESVAISCRQAQIDARSFGPTIRHSEFNEVLEHDLGNSDLASQICNASSAQILNDRNLLMLESAQNSDLVPLSGTTPSDLGALAEHYVRHSPLDAWLQSADSIPYNTHNELLQDQEALEREAREIEILRKVHLPRGSGHAGRVFKEFDDFDDLEVGARPFYRKIRDKFPLLSPQLCRHFAINNMLRDRRLRLLREASDGDEIMEEPQPPAVEEVSLETPSKYDFEGRNQGHEVTKHGAVIEEPYQNSYGGVQLPSAISEGSHSAISSDIIRQIVSKITAELMEKRGMEKQTTLDAEGAIPPRLELGMKSSEKGMKKKHRRASSIYSNISSINSPLRGSMSDTDYQRPEFSRHASPAGSAYEIEYARPSLPPQPQADPRHKDNKVKCDLCGAMVPVHRKRDWQKHIISDLQPYSCIHEGCPFPSKTFSSFPILWQHTCNCKTSAVSFQDNSSRCPFCNVDIARPAQERLRHLSRHMEEIAFTVVPRSYEDWTFYSDSDGITSRTSPTREEAASSNPIILKSIRGPLFETKADSTDRLKKFLSGIALYLIEEYEPKHSLVVTPLKMQRYYEDFKIRDEMYPWHIVFDDATSSISRLYRYFSAEHHLVQERLDERPDIPGLTPNGFATWVIQNIYAHPDQESRRLKQFVQTLPPASFCGFQERSRMEDPDYFVENLLDALLPAREDHAIVSKLQEALSTHCNVSMRSRRP